MPVCHVKGEDKQWKSSSPEIAGSSHSTIVVEFGKNKSLPWYQELFNQDDKMKVAMLAGIRDKYPEFSSTDSRPEDIMPIIKAPFLVREVQLVILELLQHNPSLSNDIQWLIASYLSLYGEFRSQLKTRLQTRLDHEA